MKRFIAIIIAVLSLLLVLGGCGETKQPGDQEQPPVQDDPKDPVIIPPVPEKKVDPRWENEVVSDEAAVIIAIAKAYWARRTYIQYDQLMMDRYTRAQPRYDFATPETATMDRTVYMECGVFVRNVLLQCYDWKMPTASTLLAENYPNTSGERVFYWVGNSSVTAEDKEKAKQQVYDILQPGDVLCYNYVGNNHLWLYLSEGNMLNCTGSDYQYPLYCDTRESAGGILYTTVDAMFAERDIFALTNKVTIIRPTVMGMKLTEQAKLRAEKLQDTLILKTASVTTGESVTPGGEVEITVKVRNQRTEALAVTVTDEVPENMVYVGGCDAYANGKMSWALNVPAGENGTIKYKLKVVQDDALLGKQIHVNKTAVEGVVINDTPVFVGYTMDGGQRNLFAKLQTSAVKAANDTELVADVYKKALGIELITFKAKETLTSLYPKYPAASQSTAVSIDYDEKKVAAQCLVPMLYGGQNVNTNINLEGERTKEIKESWLVEGDVIVCSRLNTGESARMYVYIGEGRILGVENGAVKEYKAADILDTLLGCFCFAVLRPSFII